MYTYRHSLVGLLCLLAVVPLASVSALTQVDNRYKTTEDIRHAAERIVGSDAAQDGLTAEQQRSKTQMQSAAETLQDIAKKKRVIRLQLANALARERELLAHGVDTSDSEAVILALQQEKNRLLAVLRTFTLTYAERSTEAIGALLGKTLVGSTLGERTEAAIRVRAVLVAREQLLTMLRSAQGLPEVIAQLRNEHEAVLLAYGKAQQEYDKAGERLHSSAAEQSAIERTVAEVQAQIVKMQAELARIDARVRRKAERALIEKGLMAPKEGEYTSGKIVGDSAKLSWPAQGRVSAGFYNKEYQQYFGFPHKGIDIVIPQGTPVYAAAEGVVFLARPGGKTGYTYVLIGHQGGTATLYGHLSQIDVATGQDVQRGQRVGLSGGTPGTWGAGPMTTGAHLHFEVIQNGKHVDPITVLP